MPAFKTAFAWPLVFNRSYLSSVSGIVKCIHCLLTLISTVSLWLSCRSVYDPYLGTWTGFIGGDLETICLLVYCSFMFFSVYTICIYYFSIVAATIISKTVHVSMPSLVIRLTMFVLQQLVYDLLAAVVLMPLSLSLMIRVIQRNRADQYASLFPVEPGYAGKLVSSSSGLIASLLYAFDAFHAYHAYAHT